MNIKTVLLWL